MDGPYEAALAEVTRLAEQRQSWSDKRMALQSSLEDTQTKAGEAALAGTSTSKIAEQIARMQTELQIVDRALTALDLKETEVQRAAQRARIADMRLQAEEKRQHAAAVKAEAEPYLAALERIEGVRPSFARSLSIDLEFEVDRIENGIEYLEFKLEHPL